MGQNNNLNSKHELPTSLAFGIMGGSYDLNPIPQDLQMALNGNILAVNGGRTSQKIAQRQDIKSYSLKQKNDRKAIAD